MGRVKLAIFDLYGTVVTDDGVVEESIISAFRAVGAGISHADLVPLKGISKKETIKTLCDHNFNEDEHEFRSSGLMASDVYDGYMFNVLTHWKNNPPQAIAGAYDVFLELRERGVKVAFTTGFEKELALPLLVSLGWDTHQMPYAASNMVVHGRPAPDMLFSVMAHAKIQVGNPEEAVAIGDTVRDLLAADAAEVGINVLVDPAWDDYIFLTEPVDHWVIRSVRGLPSLLASLGRL